MKKGFLRSGWLKASVALVLLVAGGWGLVRHLKKRIEAKKFEKMVETKVLKGEFVVRVQASGVVEPETKVPVMPAFGGRVEQVLVREGDAVKKGDVLAWMSPSERVALLDSAGVRKADAEELKKVEEAYRMTPLVASIDGEVIKRAVEPGQTVALGQTAFTLSDRLIVKTFVDESDIGKVRAGQPAEFILDAYLKERNKGGVVAIAYDSTTQNNVTVYEVKLLPRTGLNRLRSGMTAEVYIETDRKRGVLFLPKRAVKHKEGEAVVMLRKDPKAPPAEQKVELGATNEAYTELLKGVSEGDPVMMPSSSVPDEDVKMIQVE